MTSALKFKIWQWIAFVKPVLARVAFRPHPSGTARDRFVRIIFSRSAGWLPEIP
jgi:hypothetical protein